MAPWRGGWRFAGPFAPPFFLIPPGTTSLISPDNDPFDPGRTILLSPDSDPFDPGRAVLIPRHPLELFPTPVSTVTPTPTPTPPTPIPPIPPTPTNMSSLINITDEPGNCVSGTDCTAGIQRTLDACTVPGGVYFPRGLWQYSSALYVEKGISLIGDPGAILQATTPVP